MSINQLILNLKANDEDFEFYPTSKEMLYLIYPQINNDTVLDIGCGTLKNISKNMHKKKQIYIIVKKNKKKRKKKKMVKDIGIQRKVCTIITELVNTMLWKKAVFS